MCFSIVLFSVPLPTFQWVLHFALSAQGLSLFTSMMNASSNLIIFLRKPSLSFRFLLLYSLPSYFFHVVVLISLSFASTLYEYFYGAFHITDSIFCSVNSVLYSFQCRLSSAIAPLVSYRQPLPFSSDECLISQHLFFPSWMPHLLKSYNKKSKCLPKVTSFFPLLEVALSSGSWM